MDIYIVLEERKGIKYIIGAFATLEDANDLINQLHDVEKTGFNYSIRMEEIHAGTGLDKEQILRTKKVVDEFAEKINNDLNQVDERKKRGDEMMTGD